jgi:hypothetical protein
MPARARGAAPTPAYRVPRIVPDIRPAASRARQGCRIGPRSAGLHSPWWRGIVVWPGVAAARDHMFRTAFRAPVRHAIVRRPDGKGSSVTDNSEHPPELAAALAGLLGSQPRRTLAQLADETGLQQRTLSELTSGGRPLSWEVTCAYVTACGGDKEDVRALWTRAVSALASPPWQKHDVAGQIMGLWERRDPVGRLPDPYQAATEVELNGQLNMLRAWANVPLRELETRTWPKVSDSTLSELLNNHRRLTPQRAEILAAACGLPPWEAARWAEATARVAQAGQAAQAAPAAAARQGGAAPTAAGPAAAVRAASGQAAGLLRRPRTDRPGPSPDRPGRQPPSRMWLAVAAVVVFAAGVAAGAAVLGHGRRADFVYLRYAQPVVVTPGSAVGFVLSPLPSRSQDWYLDLRLRLGYTDPIANCLGAAQLSYRVDADGRTRGSGTSSAGQTTVAVRGIHLGPASAVRITVTVHDPVGCTLTLDPTGTAAHPAT